MKDFDSVSFSRAYKSGFVSYCCYLKSGNCYFNRHKYMEKEGFRTRIPLEKFEEKYKKFLTQKEVNYGKC